MSFPDKITAGCYKIHCQATPHHAGANLAAVVLARFAADVALEGHLKPSATTFAQFPSVSNTIKGVGRCEQL